MFKEDFDNERKDRAKAHKEMLRLRNLLDTNQKTYTDSKKEIHQRDTEIQALKDSRDRQEMAIRRLEKENEELRRKLQTRSMGDRYNIHIHGGLPEETTHRHNVVSTPNC